MRLADNGRRWAQERPLESVTPDMIMRTCGLEFGRAKGGMVFQVEGAVCGNSTAA